MTKAKKKIAFFTLGCRTNQYDSEALQEMARGLGYKIVPFSQKADFYVINSCAVTVSAITKSRRRINQACRLNPHAKIILTGCWPQVSSQDLPAVFLVTGVKNRKQIFDLLKKDQSGKKVSPYSDKERFEETGIKIFTNRRRAIVKVQEGCRQFCSYCIIPYARGPLRSRQPQKVIAEIKSLIQNGYNDITLTGTHIGLYGIDFKEKMTLADLIKNILEIKGLKYLRISSIEPNEVTFQLIKLMKENKKFYPWLHIPLQSGSDKILKLMNRPYTTKKFEQKISSIRKEIPNVKITTDVIVGFPGETEEDFQKSYKLCQRLKFSKIHVFSFSPRPGTPAATMPNQIAREIIKKRSEILRGLSQEMERKYTFGQNKTSEPIPFRGTRR